MKEKSMYEKLGIDPSKEKVKDVFKSIINNEYPNAFVNIITDPFDSEGVVTKHLDGDGSKSIQRWLQFIGDRDEKIFAGMVDDALSMNTGDIAASGFVFGPMLVADVLNCARLYDLKEVIMRQIALRFRELLKLYKDYGFQIYFLGGETADLPEQVRSSVFDISVTSWAHKSEIVKGDVEDRDVILGLHSDGQATWEEEKNSGIMSNGITLARSCLMHIKYNQVESLKGTQYFFKGKFEPGNTPEILEGMTVGEAITSPTRQWALVIKKIIEDLEEKNAFDMLHGITMNTGGGATKILNIGSGITYEKKMPEAPPIFKLIQQESGEIWENMYQSFNCGIGLDVVGENNNVFRDTVRKSAKACGVEISTLGTARKNPNPNDLKNKVKLKTPYGDFEY